MIQLFSAAGATGNVFLVKNGRRINKGLAYSGFVVPMTTVTVVPTTIQILDFAVEARTKDKQVVTIAGNLKVTLAPEKAVSQFDFTVNKKTGSYVASWQNILKAAVIEKVLAPIQEKAKELDVAVATQSHKDFETAVLAALAADTSGLSIKGIAIESCSIIKIEPEDEEIGEAIGSKEHEEMLAQADEARHARQMGAAESEREVKEYEADTVFKLEEKKANTALELEKKKAALLEEQRKNKQAEAEIEAESLRTRLAPLKELSGGTLLGAAIMEGAKNGRGGGLTITTELLTALGQK